MSKEYPIEELLEETLKENKQLNSILTELEEWIKAEYKCAEDTRYIAHTDSEIRLMENVIDKIQELKEKYK